MSSFNPGDIVELKSGGPKMTVAWVVGDNAAPKIASAAAKSQGFKDGDVLCEWFHGAEKKTSFFKAPSLKASA
jgi:uncharacterized protein YodC (DUF2158 family)